MAHAASGDHYQALLQPTDRGSNSRQADESRAEKDSYGMRSDKAFRRKFFPTSQFQKLHYSAEQGLMSKCDTLVLQCAKNS